MSDKHLIESCRKGDSKAFGRLYEIYSAKMYGICLRYVGNTDTARDILHDGFIVAYTKIKEYKGDGSFEGWLRKIFVNTALNHIRKKDLFTNIDSVNVSNEYLLGNSDVLDRMSAKELMNILAKLPEGYRTVLNLFAVEGYTHAEIGEMLGISEGTSRSQYSRAKVMLQNLISK